VGGILYRPSDFVEGGAVPVDKNLLWKECRFDIFDYTKKDGTVAGRATTARIIYVDDDGAEYVQHYSVGAPERFAPSADGLSLVAVGASQSLSKSSNFSLLINALINAGFPPNKLVKRNAKREDEAEPLSVLDGLYTYNIGMPEPKRSGLAPRVVAEGEVVREKVLSVPSQVLKLPWEKKAGGKAPAEEAGDGDAITTKAIAFVEKNLVDGETTRQKIATAIFKDKELAKDPNKDKIAALIFKAEFQGALLANGYTVDGENISKA
jgi:hypothetical protein